MGRELTIFEGAAGYPNLADGLKNNRVEKTLEFFPEEGKYHLSGHRKCGVSQTPEETVELGNRCLEYGRPLTLGVVHRVEELSGAETLSPDGLPIEELKRPYSKLVPLIELVAYSMGRGRAAKSVGLAYQRICAELGGEVKIFTQGGYADLERVGGEDLAVAVTKVRDGQVLIIAGFDGQYGVVKPA